METKDSTVQEFPSIEAVRFGRAAVPNEPEERISFLEGVFDLSRRDSMEVITLEHKRDALNINKDYFDGRVKETQESTRFAIRVGVAARQAASVARSLDVISTDQEQADLVHSLLDTLREARGEDISPDSLEDYQRQYREHEGNLSIDEADAFDGRFSEIVNTAEWAAAGLYIEETAKLR